MTASVSSEIAPNALPAERVAQQRAQRHAQRQGDGRAHAGDGQRAP